VTCGMSSALGMTMDHGMSLSRGIAGMFATVHARRVTMRERRVRRRPIGTRRGGADADRIMMRGKFEGRLVANVPTDTSLEESADRAQPP